MGGEAGESLPAEVEPQGIGEIPVRYRGGGDCVVLDVREPEEYARGRIEGAKNIAFSDPEALSRGPEEGLPLHRRLQARRAGSKRAAVHGGGGVPGSLQHPGRDRGRRRECRSLRSGGQGRGGLPRKRIPTGKAGVN
ncbi:MAG: rhodanese-like domain-containing protein [Methanomicrobiales archaeon]|nr:rhodanese-like domain-containing protein [Methanomicrobiales archaeon]